MEHIPQETLVDYRSPPRRNDLEHPVIAQITQQHPDHAGRKVDVRREIHDSLGQA
jgi:hypothetical protein